MTLNLDYNPSTQAFIVRVPAHERTLIQSLVKEHGLNFSTTASTGETAVMFTREPYAAAAFYQHGTRRAQYELGGIHARVEASYASNTSWQPSWLPPGKELWPFQRCNIEYALSLKNSLVGDQPGLGKTEVGICFANEIEARRVLVICPANIRGQWARRIREWSRLSWQLGRDLPVRAIVPSNRSLGHITAHEASWTIVSYDLAWRPAIGKILAKYKWDLLILDEAHYLKTITTQRTRAIFGGGEKRHFHPIADRAERIMALTGTPLPNRPREAYTLARGLCFDAIDWLSEDAFRERFNPSAIIEGERADGSTYRYVDERTGRHSELQSRLRANFMTRHLKREVMPQLQLPTYDLIQVEETGAVKQALNFENLLEFDPEHLEGANAEVLGHISSARKMMGIAIAPQVADYMEMLIDGGEDKLVLFAHHVEVLNILCERLGKYGALRIDGRTSAVRKDALVQQFITDPSVKVIIGNIQAMGTGTDGLQHVSSHGLIAEPSWTPGENIQCFDRLDRGGQRNAVQGDIFVAPGSLAERILASALRKLRVTHSALDERL